MKTMILPETNATKPNDYWRSRRNKRIIQENRQAKMTGIFWPIQMELQMTNNDNPGTANVKTWALLLTILNHGWRKKKMEKKKRSHNYIAQRYMDVAKTPCPGTDSSSRYQKEHQIVYLKLEIKRKLTVMTCCLVIKETVNPLIQ